MKFAMPVSPYPSFPRERDNPERANESLREFHVIRSVMENNIRSLRSYLMQRLLISLYLLWIVSTVVGYFATINYANQPYDIVLLQRANEVAAELKLGSGHERLDVVPALPDGSDVGMPDRVLYTVTDSEGRKLAGNGNTLRPLSY